VGSKRFLEINRFFKISDPHEADPTNAKTFFQSGIEHLRENGRDLWKFGSKTSADDGRVSSKSKQNPYKTRGPMKPVRMGWEWLALCDRGIHTMGFAWDFLVMLGQQTYDDLDTPKHYQVIKQLVYCISGSGRTVVFDKKFFSMELMEDGRLWNLRFVCTVVGNPTCIPNMLRTKTIKNHFFKKYEHDLSMHYHSSSGVNLTLYNDRNAFLLADNGLDATDTEEWINHATSSDKETEFSMPTSVSIYKQNFHFVDRKNQHISYQNVSFKAKRKYNGLIFKLMEMFGLDNAWIIFVELKGRNGENVDKQHRKFGQRSCRAELFRKWAKENILRNSKLEKINLNHQHLSVAPILDQFKPYHEQPIAVPGRGICRFTGCQKKVGFSCMGCSMNFSRPIFICKDHWRTVHLPVLQLPDYNRKQ